MDWNTEIWCQKCHRPRVQHVPGEDAVYVEQDGEAFIVACTEAQPYLTPHGNGRLLNPEEVDDGD